MNYASARERKGADGQGTGRWDWTVSNNRTGTHPAGYCLGWRYDEWLARGDGMIPRQLLEQERDRRIAFKDKYHTAGHPTKEDAERCYRDYQLDIELREINARAETRHQCQSQERADDTIVRCQEWTERGLAIGAFNGEETWLCDQHRTREVFERLHPFRPGRTEAFS